MNKNGTQHHDGIDIKAKGDQPVIASSDGKVAFVGSNIRSFGNMILIKHNKEWISAYSKVEIANVTEGDFVKKGQIIGSLKDAKTLHFQIFHN